LDGLFEYNSKKSLDKPKAERVLEFFDEIHLSIVEIDEQIYHTITGLSAKHREILTLMDIGIEAYEILGEIQRSEL
jgi:transposase, IS4 family